MEKTFYGETVTLEFTISINVCPTALASYGFGVGSLGF